MNDSTLYAPSLKLGAILKQKEKFITCAESCTGGWISKSITDVSGSANWFESGFITYSNRAKTDLLGVRSQTLELYGAVSHPVVQEMALGALRAASADYAIAISGIAGPDGGTIKQPIGTILFGFAAITGAYFSEDAHFKGNRDAVRCQAVYYALTTFLARFFPQTTL
ncbi:nicotinamide-nucleotide amidase [Candidatus Steffania adelgidicola]|uniref:nicotinamide-nucleotide amidase n=1 Tax=Candidatus Steffania adelgidicola TaxID=1076626 RepID=UPI003B968C8A